MWRWMLSVRRWISWTLALLLVGLIPTPILAGPALSDIQQHWARPQVQLLVARGLVNGMPDGTFRPDTGVTRAQFAKLLVMALGKDADARVLQNIPSSFTDVPVYHWAHGYLELGRERGFVQAGFGQPVKPEEPLSRLQTVEMLVRALGPTDGFPAARLTFSDASSIPADLQPLVQRAVDLGLVTGLPDGRFAPDDPVNRAQAAVMLARFLGERGALYDLTGDLDSLDAAHGQLTLRGVGGPVTVAADAYVSFNGKAATLADLQPLYEVSVLVDRVTGKATYVDARFADGEATVDTVDARLLTLSVKQADGTTAVLQVRADAVVYRNGQTAQLTDLKPGDRAYLIYAWRTGEVRVLSATGA